MLGTLAAGARTAGALSRHVGVTGALADLPAAVVVLAALVTQMGDVWLLSLVVAVTYWYGPAADWLDRERAGAVLALWVGALAVLVVGKGLLAVPRPPGAGTAPHADVVPEALRGAYVRMSTADGYGVPSGHALGSTVVYGALAWALDAGRRRQRVSLAAGLVSVVALSRLVLGVHYAVDVVGAVLGVVVVAAGTRLDPARTLAGATAVAAVGLVAVGGHEVAGAFGVALGAAAAWRRLPAPEPTRRGGRATVALGVGCCGPLLAAASVVPRPVLAALGGVVGGALLVALPAAGERLAAIG